MNNKWESNSEVEEGSAALSLFLSLSFPLAANVKSFSASKTAPYTSSSSSSNKTKRTKRQLQLFSVQAGAASPAAATTAAKLPSSSLLLRWRRWAAAQPPSKLSRDHLRAETVAF